MAAFNVNEYYCHNCTYSDAYGRGCKINLMMPVMLAMMGFDRCPKLEQKNKTQLREQLDIILKNNKNDRKRKSIRA